MRSAVVIAGLVVAASAGAAHADPSDDEEAVRAAARAFVTAVRAGADDVIETAFAPTVKLVKVSYDSDECTKAFARKRSLKRGRAKLMRCIYPDVAALDPDAPIDVQHVGTTWDAQLGDRFYVFRFRKRKGAYVIERISAVTLQLARFVRLGPDPGVSGPGLGTVVATGSGVGTTGTGTGVAPSMSPTITIRIAPVTGELGGRDADAVTAVLASRRGVLKACYQKQLNRNPNLTGSIRLAVTVDADGRVASVAATADSTIDDDELASCLRSQVVRLTFGAGDSATITVTLELAH